MIFLYRAGISIYVCAIRVASLFHRKARLWVQGRRNWRNTLKSHPGLEGCIWVHCSSLGEFEQGRPLIEAIREKSPETKILLTFFSPSGYEVRKNYPHADLVMYLPADTPRNAREFLELVKPSRIIFVKYDLWYFFLREIYRRKIPAFLISAVFREGHFLLRGWAASFARSLDAFSVIFTQDQSSKERIQQVRSLPVEVAGDTRIDRVLQIRNEKIRLPEIEDFLQGNQALVCGSVWPADMKILAGWINTHPEAYVIIAPHDVSPAMVKEIREMVQVPSELYSVPASLAEIRARVLIIDRIGLLNKIYQYGWISYIGGGFGKSIHNTLEPAVYGIPVITGPKIGKFPEAVSMHRLSSLFIVKNTDELAGIIGDLAKNDAERAGIQGKLNVYFSEQSGATRLILGYLF